MAHRRTNKMTAYAAVRAETERRRRLKEQRLAALKTIAVFTDASYNNQRRCGAIAFSAFSDDKRLMKRVMLINRKSDVTYLEMLAVYTALRDLKKDMNDVGRAEVYCDNSTVVRYINNKIRHQKKKAEELRRLAAKITTEFPFAELKHIEAHTGRPAEIYRRNAEVDYMCRERVRTHLVKTDRKAHHERVERDKMICALVAAQQPMIETISNKETLL